MLVGHANLAIVAVAGAGAQQRIILPQLEMDLACMDHAHGAAEIGVMPFPLVTVDLYVHPRLHGTQNRTVR